MTTNAPANSITCGSFSARTSGDGTWRFECSRLPGWSHEVSADERSARRALHELQAAYRDAWAEDAA